jgi:hypothetical protein
MKLLQNEFDCRTRMTDEFLEYDDSPSSAMSQDELEQELQRLMPLSFPCLVYVAYSGNPNAPERLVFTSRNQVTEWAAAMGLT